MTWVLTLLGPVWAVARPFLPAVSALKGVGMGALVAAALAAGVWLVWTARDWSERDRIEEAANAIVERRSLAAENAALKDMADRQLKSEAVSRERAEAFAKEAAATKAALSEVEQKLAGMSGVRLTPAGRVVCYPKEIVEALNR